VLSEGDEARDGDRGVLGSGRLRVVAWGKESEGDDSFRSCCIKAVRGRVYVRATTLGSSRCTRCMWQIRTLMECQGPRSVQIHLGGSIVIAIMHSSRKTSGGEWLGES
jgi:hypothetical protein